MAPIITYSLQLEDKNSDNYYQAIADFANRWMNSIADEEREFITGFNSHLKGLGVQTRSEAEYALELLALGVLLRGYQRSSSHFPHCVIHFMALLAEWQGRWPKLEPTFKTVRGVLQGVFLNPNQTISSEIDLRSLDLSELIRWETAQGEAAISKRLSQWQEYLNTLPSSQELKLIEGCLALSDRFSDESQYTLGKYTQGVESFITQTAPKYRWRYDQAFVSRHSLEYHLGMLATEVLNGVYRQRFLMTKRKIVILPPCMREQPDTDCKAIETPLGARCQACKPNCRVHHVTRMGEKYGFEVFIIPDELRSFGADGKGGTRSIGLVGVSCALTNWSGGWDADSMEIPAQGLLLDYVGCRYHWDKQGISTDTNLTKLLDIISTTDEIGE